LKLVGLCGPSEALIEFSRKKPVRLRPKLADRSQVKVSPSRLRRPATY